MKAILIICCLLATCASGFMTTVHEGNVGVKYYFGSLQEHIYTPGLHFHMILPITSISEVNVRPQTDQVYKVACGTTDGLNLVFEHVDVGNTLKIENVYNTIKKYGEDYDQYLVKDKIRHQIQVICSAMTANEVFITKFDYIDDMLKEFLQNVNDELGSGLIIDFVRMSKPTLPPDIRENYEKIAFEITKLKVEIERQERLKKELETKRMMEEKEQEIIRYKNSMENENHLLRKRAEEQMAEIENQIALGKGKIDAEIIRIRMSEEALGIRNLYEISGYPQVAYIKEVAGAMKDNSKFFFGDKIPHFMPTYGLPVANLA